MCTQLHNDLPLQLRPASVLVSLISSYTIALYLLFLVVTFGDADRDETFGSVATSKVLIICHDGDNICDNGIIITAQHRNYEIDAPAAAAFVAGKVA